MKGSGMAICAAIQKREKNKQLNTTKFMNLKQIWQTS